MRGFSWCCSVCAADYRLGGLIYTCLRCAQQGRLDLVIDYAAAGRGQRPEERILTSDQSMWRYRALLPVAPPTLAAVQELLPVGWTPLCPLPRLGARLGLPGLWVKNEAGNLTGSLKDRASALVAAAASAVGAETIATASTGNAAASLAGVAAAVGVRCVAFVPEQAPLGKVAQLGVFGAQVVRVQGDYDDTFRLCWQACQEWGWYCRSTAVNPFTAEGKKTAALEILEQSAWSPPDAVVVPVGDGNIITGLYRGFRDALQMGWTNRLPRLIGVQAASASALYQAWRAGADHVTPKPARTIADGISVADPQDGYRALAAVRATGGVLVTVTDEEILNAMSLVARTSGIFAEPASAAAFAGLPVLVANRDLASTDTVVVVHTGSGLKALDVVRDLSTNESLLVPPRLDALGHTLRSTCAESA